MTITLAEPYIGFQVALTEGNKEPVTADLVGRLNTVSGIGFTVNSIDTTSVSSITGYVEQTPLLKELKPISVTVFYNKAGYDRIRGLATANGIQGDDLLLSLTIFYPTLNADRTNYRYVGFLKEFDESDASVGDVQKFTFTFQPITKPVVTKADIEYDFTNDTASITTSP